MNSTIKKSFILLLAATFAAVVYIRHKGLESSDGIQTIPVGPSNGSWSHAATNRPTVTRAGPEVGSEARTQAADVWDTALESFPVLRDRCSLARLELRGAAAAWGRRLPQGLECPDIGSLLPRPAAPASDWLLPPADPRAHCCLRPFERLDEETVRFSSSCKPLRAGGARAPAEFVQAECRVRGGGGGGDGPPLTVPFAFAPPLAQAEQRASAAGVDANDKAFSVLVLGVDALSAGNLRRQLPRSLARLRQLGAVEVHGLTSSGEHSQPNVLPLLAGIDNSDEFPCWANANTRLDECPFIWKRFGAAGYRTAYGEDGRFADTFHWNMKGFRGQPTDYYLRPLFVVSEPQPVEGNYPVCIGPNLVFAEMLHYIRRLAANLMGRRYFGFFWINSAFHNLFNVPPSHDEALLDALNALDSFGTFNETFFVLVGDHGPRYGPTKDLGVSVGERRSPALLLLAPPDFRRQHPAQAANLAANARTLLTHWDLHETLLDMLALGGYAARPRGYRSFGPGGGGVSLFQRVPDRSCEGVGLSARGCPCFHQQAFVLPLAKQLESQLSRAVEAAVQTMAEDAVNCTRPQVERVESLRTLAVPSMLRGTKTDLRGWLLHAKVLLLPSHSWVHAVVRVRGASAELVGEPRCVDPALPPLCFC